MKTLFLIFFSAISIGSLSSLELNCNNKKDESHSPPLSKNAIQAESNSLVYWGNKYGLIYQKNNRTFHLLQYQNKPSSEYLFTDPIFVQSGTDYITLNDVVTGTTKSFGFSSNFDVEILGFAISSGQSVENSVLTTTNSGETIFNPLIFTGENPPEALSCVCCTTTACSQESCSSGGIGADSCSSSDGGTGSSCSVSCSGGLYACCNT